MTAIDYETEQRVARLVRWQSRINWYAVAGAIAILMMDGLAWAMITLAYMGWRGN